MLEGGGGDEAREPSEGTSPRNVYATSDGGWVAISASTQAMTERLFRAIGRDDLNRDPAFKTNSERVKRRAEVDAIVGGFIKERTLVDAITFLEDAEVTAAPVYDIGQFLEDPARPGARHRRRGARRRHGRGADARHRAASQ